MVNGCLQVAYLLQGNNLNPFNGTKVTTFASALRNALVRRSHQLSLYQVLQHTTKPRRIALC